jgi:hypothetical protein
MSLARFKTVISAGERPQTLIKIARNKLFVVAHPLANFSSNVTEKPQRADSLLWKSWSYQQYWMKMSLEKDSSKGICLSSYFSRTSVATSRVKVVCIHKCVAPDCLCPFKCIISCILFCKCRLKLSHKVPFPDTWPLRGRPHEHEDFRRQKLDWQMIAKGTGSPFTSGPMEFLWWISSKNYPAFWCPYGGKNYIYCGYETARFCR